MPVSVRTRGSPAQMDSVRAAMQPRPAGTARIGKVPCISHPCRCDQQLHRSGHRACASAAPAGGESAPGLPPVIMPRQVDRQHHAIAHQHGHHLHGHAGAARPEGAEAEQRHAQSDAGRQHRHGGHQQVGLEPPEHGRTARTRWRTATPAMPLPSPPSAANAPMRTPMMARRPPARQAAGPDRRACTSSAPCPPRLRELISSSIADMPAGEHDLRVGRPALPRQRAAR